MAKKIDIFAERPDAYVRNKRKQGPKRETVLDRIEDKRIAKQARIDERLKKGMHLMVADDLHPGMYFLTDTHPAQIVSVDRSRGDIIVEYINTRKQHSTMMFSKQSVVYGKVP